MNKFFTNFRAKTFIFLTILVFAHFSQNSISAQKKTGEQKTVSAPAVEPKVLIKVSQVDDAKLKEILKPKDGKPLLVNFWATWCEPCREEFPDLVKIAGDYQGKLDVVTVSLDDITEINTSVPQFLSEMKALMPTYLLVSEDESAVIGSISKEWSGGLPFTILYNEKGELLYFKQGKFKTIELREKIEDSAKSSQTAK